MKNTGFNGYVCYFSVNYDAIAVVDILDIHKNLMKKKNGGKYLVISPDNGLMDEYKEGWGETKNEIKSINSDKTFEYDKDFMKSKFDSDDDL